MFLLHIKLNFYQFISLLSSLIIYLKYVYPLIFSQNLSKRIQKKNAKGAFAWKKIDVTNKMQYAWAIEWIVPHTFVASASRMDMRVTRCVTIQVDFINRNYSRYESAQRRVIFCRTSPPEITNKMQLRTIEKCYIKWSLQTDNRLQLHCYKVILAEIKKNWLSRVGAPNMDIPSRCAFNVKLSV